MEGTTLDRLEPGRKATVSQLLAPSGEQLRLMELGFIPGRTVSALQVAPWGDPVAYAVCALLIFFFTVEKKLPEEQAAIAERNRKSS